MRTNSSGVTEVAHLRTDLEKFQENFDRIDWSIKPRDDEKKEKESVTQEVDLEINE